MSFAYFGRRVAGLLLALVLLMVPMVLLDAQTPAALPPPAPQGGAPATPQGGGAATPQTPAGGRGTQPGAPATQGGTTTPGAQDGAATEPPKVPGLAGAIQGTPASDPVKGAAILAEARKALGGDDKLKAVQRLEIKGKSARAMGNSAVEGDFEVQLELPDKFRRKETLAISNDRGFVIDILQVLNGAVAMQKVEAGETGGVGNWEGEGNRGRGGSGNRGRGNFNAGQLLGITTEGLDERGREEAEHKAIAAEMSRVLMGLLLTTTDSVVWIGTAKSPHGNADVLEFKTPDGVATRLFVDDKRHLPLMISWTGIPSGLGRGNFNNNNNNNNNRGGGPRGGNQNRGNQSNNRPAPLQMYFSDYKTVNGIKLPHLIQGGANDETSEELVVKAYRVNPVLKADLFVFVK